MGFVTVERGIYKHCNKFYIKKTIDGKQSWLSFDTLEEAREARQAYLEERADARANAPVNPDREANVARNGNSCAQERNFILNDFKREAEAQEFEVRVLNDGTRSDVAIRRRGEDLYLPIQVKTTEGGKRGQERTYQFKHTKGYGGMPVFCWVVGEQRGWVFCGDWLDKRKSKYLSVTPNPLQVKPDAALPHALSGETPLGIDGLVWWFKTEWESELAKYPRYSFKFLSWEFGGEAFNQAKERLAIHNYIEHLDQKASFPEEEQNGPCLLYTSPSPRDGLLSRMPSSA